MKNVLSHRIVKIAHFVSLIPFAKTLLKPFYYPYKKRLNKRRNTEFVKNAIDVIKVFDDCLTDKGIDYCLLFGSMLGAVREKGFIKHDLDIDTAIWYEDFSPNIKLTLEEAGFQLLHTFEIDNGKLAREDTFVYKNVSIDIFYIYPPIDKYPYCSSMWKPVEGCITLKDSMKKWGYIEGKRLELPLKKEFVRVPFESLLLPIPTNADEILSFYYGEDYMSSKPEWKEEKDFPYRKKWVNKKATMISY